MSKHLVLVVDCHRARILAREGLKLQQIGPSLETSDLIEQYDKGSAKPGRISNVKQSKATTPGASHVYAPRTSLKDIEEENFLRKIANHINNDFPEMESLVLVAPPEALGELRKLLEDKILAKVEHEVVKDLTKAREDEILEYVKKPYV